MPRTWTIAATVLGLTIVALVALGPSAAADRECSVASTPAGGAVTCAEAKAGVNGRYDEACECWTSVALNGFGDHQSLVAPATGTVEIVYENETVFEDRCRILIPGRTCETGGLTRMQDLPSGFCFDVVAKTETQGGVDDAQDRLTFCAPV